MRKGSRRTRKTTTTRNIDILPLFLLAHTCTAENRPLRYLVLVLHSRNIEMSTSADIATPTTHRKHQVYEINNMVLYKYSTGVTMTVLDDKNKIPPHAKRTVPPPPSPHFRLLWRYSSLFRWSSMPGNGWQVCFLGAPTGIERVSLSFGRALVYQQKIYIFQYRVSIKRVRKETARNISTTTPLLVARSLLSLSLSLPAPRRAPRRA